MVNTALLEAMAWISSARRTLVEALKQENGQDLLEYAVLAGAIALVAGGVLFAFGFDFTNFGERVESCINFNDGNKCAAKDAPAP